MHYPESVTMSPLSLRDGSLQIEHSNQNIGHLSYLEAENRLPCRTCGGSSAHQEKKKVMHWKGYSKINFSYLSL